MMDDVINELDELRIEEIKRLRALLSRAVSYLYQYDDEGFSDCGEKSQGLLVLIAEIESELE